MMSQPAANSKRSPSPSGTPEKKRSLRQRVGTIARRTSSFVLPSRSASPAARRDPEDPMNEAGTARKAPTSKPSSIHSVEPSQPVPLAMPQEKTEEPEEILSAEAPAAPGDLSSSARVETTPAASEAAPQIEPVLKPAPETTVSEARSVEAQNPVEAPYAPEYVPVQLSETSVVERPEEPRPEHPQHEEPHEQPQGEGIHIPVSDSPKSISASLPSQDIEHRGATGSGASTPRSSSELNRHLKPLSLNTSQENLRTDLSPIPEDERSALEEYKMPFAQPNGMAASNLRAPPINEPTISQTTSNGTTPRAMPVPIVAVEPPVGEYKGKAKDVSESTVDSLENFPHADGYFSRSAPMPVPQAPHESHDLDDPFRDPTPSTTHYESMPEPDTHDSHAYNVSEHRVDVEPVHAAAPAVSMPVAYPLPPLNEVTHGNLHSVPSDYTLGARSSRAPSVHNDVPIDETLPLLSGPKSSTIGEFSKRGDGPYRDLQSAGWIAHALPDSTTYYSHPGMRVTTDINLEKKRKLNAVMNYLEGKMTKEIGLPVDDLEIWLHDEAKSRDEFVPVRCWVDHEVRALGYWPPPKPEDLSRASSDDRLDNEYRYWAFMETHPAHTPLPVNAYAEAWDKLTWSYTERLLKSNRRAPPPFTQQESQELLTLLRSSSGSDSPLQAAIQTRVVSRIHRRIVQWKQHFFRPEKPLPRGVNASATPQRSTPYNRTFLDFVLAWLCLGIPYLYANRHVYRFDEEGGIVRSAGPMVVVGATVCIVAATILLASVTFLALPGLDHVSRTAGFIAIIASFSSFGASLIAAFRNQVETQRMAARGGEGLVVTMSAVTGNSILPSLPAVFLAWSILSLITGVVLYAFRGSIALDAATRFASFTRWTTIVAPARNMERGLRSVVKERLPFQKRYSTPV
ncbi:hypothetical protein ACEPAF_6124 [Sanghuangporus sanghuang]